jgi:hypothetical protein
VSRQRAVLTQPVLAYVTWPDGLVGAAWELAEGTVLDVSSVTLTDTGFVLCGHPVDAPELFTVTQVADVDPVGIPVPF